jgi:cell pole-organizing protein PopZ
MSDQTSQEPTMEEILASIRRIISEDDAPADEVKAEEAPAESAAPEPAAAYEPEPEPEPAPTYEAAAPEPEPEDDALELTERVDQVGDLDVYSPTAAPASSEPESAVYSPPPSSYEPVSRSDDEGLLSQTAATAAASAFGQLSAAIAMPHTDRTLEDVVREMLRPLLKQWLDDNLPQIVEASVREEVERIARGRVR